MATLSLPEPFQGRPRSGRSDAEQLRLYDELGIELPFFRFGSPERRYFRLSSLTWSQLWVNRSGLFSIAQNASSLVKWRCGGGIRRKVISSASPPRTSGS